MALVKNNNQSDDYIPGYLSEAILGVIVKEMREKKSVPGRPNGVCPENSRVLANQNFYNLSSILVIIVGLLEANVGVLS